jgi:glycosyltransferase involved in cell wall biosynthesis
LRGLNIALIACLCLKTDQFAIQGLSGFFYLPTVAIFILDFNKMKYLNRSIPSALRQTYSHFELLVVDDGLTDGSIDAIGRHALTDEPIRVFRNKLRKSTNVVRLMGVLGARGLFLISLDSDDALVNHTLELDLRAALLHRVDMVQHHAIWVQADGGLAVFWET